MDVFQRYLVGRIIDSKRDDFASNEQEVKSNTVEHSGQTVETCVASPLIS